MRIKSKNPKSTFCYHISRAPVRDMAGGEEAVAIFSQIAIGALSFWKESLEETGDWPLCEELPLGHLNAQQQCTACTALLLAMHQPGFEAENWILEQLLHEALRIDFELACDAEHADDWRLKSWGRLAAIWFEKTALIHPKEVGWGELSQSLFWDDDWTLFLLTPESIAQTKEDLRVYEGFCTDGAYPKESDKLWRDYKWTNTQIRNIDERARQLWPNSARQSVDGTIDAKPQPSPTKPDSGCVYCIREKDGHLKVGKTTGSPVGRLKSLQTANPKILEVCFAIKHQDHSRIERQIHGALDRYRVAGEWFNCPVEEVRRIFQDIEDAEWIEGGAA